MTVGLGLPHDVRTAERGSDRAREDATGTVVVEASPETVPSPRIFIVDDHPLMAEGLALALRREGLEVAVAPSVDPHAVLDAAERFGPDLVLLDLMLGEVPSVDLIQPLTAGCGARVMMVTGITDPVMLASCLEAGAVGLASKTQPFPRLLDQVMRIIEGGSPLSEQERAGFLDTLRRHRSEEHERLAPFGALTRREQEILASLVDGNSPQQIAEASFVGEGTVRSQIKAIFRKLGVNSQLAAVAAARKAGWSLERLPAAR